MAIYGSDISALLDAPDPEIIVTEQQAAAIACAKRWLTPQDALTDVGETEDYDSLDVFEWMGASVNLSDTSVQDDLAAQATQVLQHEPYAQNGVKVTVTYSAAPNGNGTLTLTAYIADSPGPFSLVLQNGTNGVTAALLMPGQV